MSALTAKSGGADDNDAQAGHLVATIQRRGREDGSQDEIDISGVHPALRAGDGGSSRGNAVAYAVRMREGKPGGGKGPLVSEEQSLTLATSNDQVLAIPIDMRHASDSEHPTGVGTPGTGIGEPGDPAFGLNSSGATQAVATEWAVRRLTPRECERLQGFPDDWTGEQKDSHRYRQMGNAVAVNVAEWIAGRIRTRGSQETGSE